MYAGSSTPSGGEPEISLLATSELLRRAKDGDGEARTQLLARYLPRLRRWASGRLPMHARSLVDTVDLVQETMIAVLEGLDRIEVRGPGGFQAYVRQAVLNRIRDQVRWSARRAGPELPPEAMDDRAPSPLENAIGLETLTRYESALDRLSDAERGLVHLRIEMDLGYGEIAEMTGKPSRDAARVAIRRALGRLAEEMGHER